MIGRATGQHPQAAADARAGRQRRGEDAAGDAAPVGGDCRQQFGGAEVVRLQDFAVQRLCDGVIAGAVSLAVRVVADGGKDEAEQRGKHHRMAHQPAAKESGGVTKRALGEQAGENAARDAADHAAERDPENHVRDGGRAGVGRKIGIVALDGDENEARCQHAEQQAAFPAQMQAAPQFLNREDDARKRRVESGGKPACGAGGNQLIRAQTAKRKAVAATVSAPGEHHRSADLYRRPFAPDRSANQHRQKRQRDFPQRLRPGDEALLVRAIRQAKCGDDLRDTAARHIRRVMTGEPGEQRHAGRQDEPRRERPGRRPKAVGIQRIIGQGGESERGERDQRRPEEQAGKFQRVARNTRGLAQFFMNEMAQFGAACAEVGKHGSFRK